ncbi:MAG: NosD domain-containing protein [Ignisphaera sp.]
MILRKTVIGYTVTLMLLFMVTIIAIPIHTQNQLISIRIDGGSGNCHFYEGEKEYGWVWCPSEPVNGEYISCSCINIGGQNYSIYKLLKNLDNIAISITGSGIIFDGQNHVINGNNYRNHSISIKSASNIVIGNITVKNFNTGIYIDQASNIDIRYCSLENNDVGISIGPGIGNVRIFNNNINNNRIGIKINHSSVTLCLNNFFNNLNDVSISFDYIVATWSCQIGDRNVGNFWQSLSNPDDCRAKGDDDGLCKILDNNNIDFYPFDKMLPVPIPEPLIIPLIVFITILALSLRRK